MPRKVRDNRYYLAIDAATDILIADFGVLPENVIVDDRLRKEPLCPDVFDRIVPPTLSHKVGVVVGVLREDTLLKFLDTYEWIVHLPLPEKFGVNYAPTHFRCFKRTRAIEKGGGSHHEIWGGSLTHGRSQLTTEQKVRIDAGRIAKSGETGETGT